MNVRKMVICAVFTALLCICAWLSIPLGDISVTMQTFGVFLCLGMLGGKYGTVSIAVYLLLGAVGIPVFSGFRGGVGTLLGTTGGYIWGFLSSGLIYWLITRILGNSGKIRIFALVLGLLACYGLGSIWFLHIYLDGGSASFGAVLLKCVVPYLLPDLIKLLLAHTLTKRLRPYISI